MSQVHTTAHLRTTGSPDQDPPALLARDELLRREPPDPVDLLGRQHEVTTPTGVADKAGCADAAHPLAQLLVGTEDGGIPKRGGLGVPSCLLEPQLVVDGPLLLLHGRLQADAVPVAGLARHTQLRQAGVAWG